MAVNRYRDVVIVAENTTAPTANRAGAMRVHVFDSPVGQSESAVEVAISDDVWESVGLLERRTLVGNLNAQVILGRALADLLLPESVREMVRRSLDRIGDDEGLRLRLRLDDGLDELPWEYLYLQPAGEEPTPLGFLALNPRISITRHEALPVPGDWYETPDKRRVVVAMASPEPYTRFKKLAQLPTEQAHLRSALSGVAGIDAAFAPDLEGHEPNGIASVTLADLTRLLHQRADIFHYAGHGEYVQAAAGGRSGSRLVLADDENQALLVDAERFAEMLRGKGIRLVVLGACEAAKTEQSRIWSGVATALLGVGIPAVVAMQYTVRDDLAATFAASFYRALVAGLTVDEAMTAGRIAMHTATREPAVMDWGVPVLYLRSPGGTIFNPVSDADVVAEAQQAAHALIAEQEMRVVAESGTVKGAVIHSLSDAGPAGTSVEITQRVSETVAGVMVGAEIFELGPTGDIRVVQEADTVSGEMTGLVIGKPAAAQPIGPAGVAAMEEALDVTRPD